MKYDWEHQQVEAHSANAIAKEPQTEGSFCSYGGSPASFSALIASNTANSLKISWILDGELDVHLYNDAKKWNFKFLKRLKMMQ